MVSRLERGPSIERCAVVVFDATEFLGLWLLVSVGGPWFARDLNSLLVFGFPAGYWVAAQGALFAFLAIVVLCVWGMERLEARYQAEVAAPDAAPIAAAPMAIPDPSEPS